MLAISWSVCIVCLVLMTTRNRRLSRSLAEAYDDLERRIAELAAQEELDAIRPDLDGGQIMQILGLRRARWWVRRISSC